MQVILLGNIWILTCLYLVSILSIHAANCGPPPRAPSTGGRILPYTSTLEGAMVTYACWHQVMHQCMEVNMSSVCNKEGNWEPASDLCVESPAGIIIITKLYHACTWCILKLTCNPQINDIISSQY